MLIDGLPGESLTKTAIRDQIPDEKLAELAEEPRTAHGPWSRLDLLVAALIDRVELLRRDNVALRGIKPAGRFEPVRRPGVAAKRRALSDEGLRYLQKLRLEHAQLHGYDPDTGVPLNPDRSGTEETG